MTEITVNLDFRCSYKSKNNLEKLLPRSLVMKLFEATSWFGCEKRSYTAASIALVNGCIACICSWLLVIYILDVGQTSRSYLSASDSIGEWLRDHEETTLVFFRSWSRYFSSMCFHVFFDKLSNKLLWLFVCFSLFSFDEIAFLVF